MTTSHHDLLTTAARLLQQGDPFALVTVLRVQAPASARPGDKAIVTPDGIVQGWIGGGCAQPAVLRAVRKALADGRAQMIRIAPAETSHRHPQESADAVVAPQEGWLAADGPALRPGVMRELENMIEDRSEDRPEDRAEDRPGTRLENMLEDVLEFGMACHSGGTLELFVDPMLPRARLTLIGDSPLAVALCGLAPRVGLPVTVVAHGADAARFPDAERVLVNDEAPDIAAGSFVVVATQGRRDVQGLRAALSVQARQVFFVASARKAQVLKASLLEAGHDAAAVAAIVAPAGQAIGAQTPEEIALSVLAAVVAARRGSPVSSSTATRATEPASAAVPELPPLPAVVKSCCGG